MVTDGRCCEVTPSPRVLASGHSGDCAANLACRWCCSSSKRFNASAIARAMPPMLRMSAFAAQEENVRRKAAAKAAAAGGAPKPAKRPWWQEELDAGAAAKRSSKAEDDAAAYRAEVSCVSALAAWQLSSLIEY